MDTITITNNNLLWLLQLTSPSLPVGAYSYSEGLETLVDNGVIVSHHTLMHWLRTELKYGAIRLDAAVIVRVYQALHNQDFEALTRWNMWLTAVRETEELRNSSLQMGRSLTQLLEKLEPEIKIISDQIGGKCNYAIAFGIATAYWKIDINAVLLGYLHSWVSNLVTAGVKLVPLGQTTGQLLLLSLQPFLTSAVEEILKLEDDDLSCCSWGVSLASMQHETLYTRLFRS
ncbi:MAG: urease accessory protein UreF [Calothrix sp. C42_A2020_038]|nr:urease accessory protein UreF [Calothrix sp. C42_A2020_038]